MNPVDDAPIRERPRGKHWLLVALASLLIIPALIFLTINATLLHLRRQAFLKACTRQAGVYVQNSSLDWERVAVPDCQLVEDNWTCSLRYGAADWRYDRALVPFAYSGNDDFGYLDLAPVPRVSYWRRGDGTLLRMTNFAALNLDQWDVGTFSYPVQHLCFAPILPNRD